MLQDKPAAFFFAAFCTEAPLHQDTDCYGLLSRQPLALLFAMGRVITNHQYFPPSPRVKKRPSKRFLHP